MSSERITLVTVVFESEVSMLKLQARSLALFADQSLDLEILLVDNTARGLRKRQRLELSDAYAQWGDRLRIVRGAQICTVPSAIGWYTQQVYKLVVANLIRTEHYIVLDAKNHWVRPFDIGYFFAQDGRSRINAYSYESHPLRQGLERVLAYMGVDPDEHIGRFTATVTPFGFRTASVVVMIEDVEARSGRPFAEVFIENGLLEFFLYSGWVISRYDSLDSHFVLEERFAPNVWPKGATLEKVQDAVARAVETGSPVFTVHRKALALLDSDATVVLIDFWVERGLFSERSEGQRYVDEFNRNFVWGERRRKSREVVPRLRNRIRAKK